MSFEENTNCRVVKKGVLRIACSQTPFSLGNVCSREIYFCLVILLFLFILFVLCSCACLRWSEATPTCIKTSTRLNAKAFFYTPILSVPLPLLNYLYSKHTTFVYLCFLHLNTREIFLC